MDKVVDLNHFWLGMEINGQKIIKITHKNPNTYLTLENGEVVKNIPSTSWQKGGKNG